MTRRTRRRWFRGAGLLVLIIAILAFLQSITGIGMIALNRDLDPSTNDLRLILIAGHLTIINPLCSRPGASGDINLETLPTTFGVGMDDDPTLLIYPRTEPYFWNLNQRHIAIYSGVLRNDSLNSYVDTYFLPAFGFPKYFKSIRWTPSLMSFDEYGEFYSLNIPTGWVLIIALIITFWIFRLTRAFRPGHCHACGYNLTNNTTGTCPECGTAFPLAPVKSDAAPQNP